MPSELIVAAVIIIIFIINTELSGRQLAAGGQEVKLFLTLPYLDVSGPG